MNALQKRGSIIELRLSSKKPRLTPGRGSQVGQSLFCEHINPIRLVPDPWHCQNWAIVASSSLDWLS